MATPPRYPCYNATGPKVGDIVRLGDSGNRYRVTAIVWARFTGEHGSLQGNMEITCVDTATGRRLRRSFTRQELCPLGGPPPPQWASTLHQQFGVEFGPLGYGSCRVNGHSAYPNGGGWMHAVQVTDTMLGQPVAPPEQQERIS